MNNPDTESADLNPSFLRALTDAQLDLYASVCVMLGNREAAKDVLQDTNVALMKHASEYDDKRAFLPWAKAFAFNQARTYRKRESRSHMVFDDDLVTAVAGETIDCKLRFYLVKMNYLGGIKCEERNCVLRLPRWWQERPVRRIFT